MVLLIYLAIDQAVFFYQQDTICSIRLVNSSQSNMTVPMLGTDTISPIIYTCNTNTGQENVYKNRPPSRSRSKSTILAPGEEIEDQFSLLSQIPDLPPGEYEISVGWEYNETEIARSNAVQIKILPSAPARLNMVNMIGGKSGNKLAAWVDLANKPHSILLSGIDLNPGGGIVELTKIAKCDQLTDPILSSPVNKTPLRSKRIAWISGKELNYAYFDQDTTKIKPRKLKLSATDPQLLAPLYSIGSSDHRALQDSLALIYSSLTADNKFQLQTVRISAKKAELIGQAELPGSKPIWTANHAHSEQNFLMTYIQAEANTLRLHSAPWPGTIRGHLHPKPLAEFKGKFLAADAALVNDGVVRGGILMRKYTEGAPNKLVIIPWTLDEDSKFELQSEHTIDWEPVDLIQAAIMRVSDGGRPVALFTDVEETWHIYDGKGKLLPMPATYQKTKQLIEIGFINGISDPLLICGTTNNGFKIIQLDGSPIPPRMIK